jgi:osmotically-inducible protein OsmY
MALTKTKSDATIQKDVLRELSWDTRVDETDVGVEVDKGIVTLTGTVSSFAARFAAQRAAHRVAGVLDVANDIIVRAPGSPGTTDTELAQAVRHALEWDAHVPHTRITSTVSGKWVTLEGNVDLWSQREDAERAVRRLAGLVGVTDQIVVVPTRVKADEIREAIEEALERRAEREAERIQVSVTDGVVTLRGMVRSYAEKRAVIGAAGFAPGVRSVEDHLRIEPFG